MKRYLLFSLLISAVLGTAPVSSSGQASAVVTVPSGLVLELDTRRGQRTTQIPLSSREPNGFWGSNFERIKGWQLPAGAKPTQAVNFEARLVDGKGELKISVFSGSRFREFVDLIATYSLNEGESATVTELAKYGFEPMPIRMRAVNAAIGNVPAVATMTKSLHISVTPIAATLPAFLVRVENRSNKAVMGFSWSTSKGGKAEQTAFPRNLDGGPLMAPGQAFEREIRSHPASDGSEADTFNVETVIFDDGSYEGPVEGAAQFLAWRHSKRATLAKVMVVLRSAVAASPARPDIPALLKSIDANSRSSWNSEVEAFLAKFPEHKHLHKQFAGWIPPSSPIVMNEVTGALRNLEKAGAGRSDADVHAALAAITNHLQKWLDRLSK